MQTQEARGNKFGGLRLARYYILFKNHVKFVFFPTTLSTFDVTRRARQKLFSALRADFTLDLLSKVL